MPKATMKKKRNNSPDFSRLTGRDTAAALGVVPKTMTRWMQAGCPRNADQTYDLPAVVAWLLERKKANVPVPEDQNESQKWLCEYRKERSKLARIERQAAEKKYVLIDDVERGAVKTGRAVRDAMLNVPSRVAAIVAAEQNVDKVTSILSKEIHSALEALSRSLDSISRSTGPAAPDSIDDSDLCPTAGA